MTDVHSARTKHTWDVVQCRCSTGGKSPAIDPFIEAGTVRMDDQAEDLVEAFETRKRVVALGLDSIVERYTGLILT